MRAPCVRIVVTVKNWAEFTFSRCKLGDIRRTNRLIKVLKNITSRVGQSIVKSCSTEAEIEGAYRLIRNEYVSAQAIAEGGSEATAELAKNNENLLAIEDSTTLGLQHSVREELNDLRQSRRLIGLRPRKTFYCAQGAYTPNFSWSRCSSSFP